MSCIQCDNTNVKWREKQNSRKVYCSRLCQLMYHSINLKIDGVNYDQLVGLESNDGERITISLDQAQEMVTVRNLIEDIGIDDYIPLISVDGATLLHIQRFLNTNSIDFNVEDDSFFKIKTDSFEKIMVAASYLDFSRLLYALMPQWVNFRPFPGERVELKDYVEDAIYFQEGNARAFIHLYAGLQYFYRWEDTGQDSLLTAIKYASNPNIVNTLLTYKDPSVNRNEALYTAVQLHKIEVVESILKDKRVNPMDRDIDSFVFLLNMDF